MFRFTSAALALTFAPRQRLVSAFDWETTIPEQALGYRFDIVLRGRDETPMENDLPRGTHP